METQVVTRIYRSLQMMRFLRMQEPKVVVAAEVVILRQSLAYDPPRESTSLTPFPNDESFCDVFVPQHRPRHGSLNPSKALQIATYTTPRSPTRSHARAPSTWLMELVSFALDPRRRIHMMAKRNGLVRPYTLVRTDVNRYSGPPTKWFVPISARWMCDLWTHRIHVLSSNA